MHHRSHSRHPLRPGVLGGALLVSLVVNAAASLGFTSMVRGGDGEVLDPDGVYDTFEVIAVSASDAPDRSPDDVRQMVSLAPPPDDEARRPDEADFADRHDRAVDEETVNPDDSLSPEPTESEPTTVAIAPSPARPTPSPAPAAPESPPRRVEPAPTEVARLQEARPVVEATTDDGPRPSRDVDGAGPDAESSDGSRDGAIAPPLDLTAFRPTPGDAVVRGGGEATSRRNDHIALPEGERTQLNSYRSMYWSFFDRMQNRLSQEWDPRSVLRVQDPTGLLYGQQDRLTILSVTLESDGSLRHAIVDRTSGLDFLDAEAVRSFEAAEPFPNVPEGLKDERGRATFRFGFHVEYGRSPVIRRMDR